jgi:hypothetical protein
MPSSDQEPTPGSGCAVVLLKQLMGYNASAEIVDGVIGTNMR